MGWSRRATAHPGHAVHAASRRLLAASPARRAQSRTFCRSGARRHPNSPENSSHAGRYSSRTTVSTGMPRMHASSITARNPCPSDSPLPKRLRTSKSVSSSRRASSDPATAARACGSSLHPRAPEPSACEIVINSPVPMSWSAISPQHSPSPVPSHCRKPMTVCPSALSARAVALRISSTGRSLWT